MKNLLKKGFAIKAMNDSQKHFLWPFYMEWLNTFPVPARMKIDGSQHCIYYGIDKNGFANMSHELRHFGTEAECIHLDDERGLGFWFGIDGKDKAVPNLKPDAKLWEPFRSSLRQYSQEQIELNEEVSVITFPEIRVTVDQMEVIDRCFLGMGKDLSVEYYQGKVNGNILMAQSAFTTREDRPDFQYIFDAGIAALRDYDFKEKSAGGISNLTNGKYSELMDKYPDHLLTMYIIESGFAGVNPNGAIVDRRMYPNAVACPKNVLFSIPEPKPLD